MLTNGVVSFEQPDPDFQNFYDRDIVVAFGRNLCFRSSYVKLNLLSMVIPNFILNITLA